MINLLLFIRSYLIQIRNCFIFVFSCLHIILCFLFFPNYAYSATSETYSNLNENIQTEEVILEIDNKKTFSKADRLKKILTEKDTDEDDNNDDVTLDNNEEDFKFFNSIFKDDNPNEDNFAEKVLKSSIRRTDIPSFLLKDDLTYKYKNGPLSQVQFFGGYRGTLNTTFVPKNLSFDYENGVFETGVYGKFRNPDYNFKIMFKPLPAHGVDYLKNFFGDMYVINTTIPHHQITAGYSRVQNGFEGSVSSFILPFANRSQIARYFGNSRSLNIRLAGNYEYADYNMSVGSSGRYITSGFPGTEFAAQINVKPFGSQNKKYGKLTIGAGINTGHNGINYTVGNLYLGYKHKKFWATAEAAIADGYNGSKGVSSNKACGYAVTAGWKFNPHLQLIARVDGFDPDRNKSGNSRNEYTAGINWFIRGQALKLFLNFVYCENKVTKDSYKFIIGTQIML